MYTVIKNKGKIVKAYQLGKDNPVVRNLAESGKIRDIGNGRYEIQSQEVINGTFRGEIARIGDWIKIDSQGYPYPNDRKYFEANHMHIEGDTFEQIPKPLQAWDAKLEICQEVIFLVKKRGLVIDESSEDKRYTAELWGTTDVAAEDAMLVFYSITYDDKGDVTDCDWNFVNRSEFEKTYNVID